jgi:hypothetical protein
MKNYAFQLWWSDPNFVVPNKIITTINPKITRSRSYTSFTKFYKFIKTCLSTRKQETTLQLISHFLKSSTPVSLLVLRQSSRWIQIKRASRNSEQWQSALAFFSCTFNIFALIQRNPASQHNRNSSHHSVGHSSIQTPCLVCGQSPLFPLTYGHMLLYCYTSLIKIYKMN